MRQQPMFVHELIGEVVAKTAIAVMPELTAYSQYITDINYQPGTFTEITKILTTMSKQPSKEYRRYPLFALIFSFNEDKGKVIGFDNEADLTLIIARRTEKAIGTLARYEQNFKPVLYPIYLEFLNQLWLDPRFSTNQPELIPHVKTDFPYYDGGNDKNPFNDCVDAIQIKIKLKILLKNC